MRKPIEQRLTQHPLIRRAHVTTELPATLVVTIEERVPVGFVVSPVLEPVDRDGEVLPLDPVEQGLDLPVLIGAGGAAALSPSQRRILAMEADRLASDDPTFLATVSEIAIDARGDVTAVVTELVSGDLLLRFRPPLSHRRLHDQILRGERGGPRRPAPPKGPQDSRGGAGSELGDAGHRHPCRRRDPIRESGHGRGRAHGRREGGSGVCGN